MLVVLGTSVTAVVRGSTGEPVILLSGDMNGEVPEATLVDVINAATAILDTAELRTVSKAIPRLGAGPADSCVSVDGIVLKVYRLTVN